MNKVAESIPLLVNIPCLVLFSMYFPAPSIGECENLKLVEIRKVLMSSGRGLDPTYHVAVRTLKHMYTAKGVKDSAGIKG